METKYELRARIRQDRKLSDITSISQKIIYKIRRNEKYIVSDNIMLFYPMRYEIDLLDLLKDNKIFYFPRVEGDNIVVCPANCEFKKSKYNIYEPCSNPVDAKLLDLIIVPALAADFNNYRLGYGGGYYDKFLAKYPNIYTITPLSKKYLYNEIPHDKYDVPINCVITD